MLKSVDVSDVLLTNTGKFLQCAVALTFEEYSNGTSAVSANSASSQQAAASYNSALNATASPQDRAAKKPTTKAVKTQ
jgi:hypothetical protein